MTNSMKDGALPGNTGPLDITSAAAGDQIALTWLERGGPAVSPPDCSAGFGSELV
ncbi:hypothetical protein [Croceibacterium mercuriale]|uniref:hypothetical protein n=1 Tax=Croceibacterium mercuriale TaxID=1572751 RepID=UPI000A67FFEB|nr:hypothetical protein [Croceibacterium mercuriale]